MINPNEITGDYWFVIGTIAFVMGLGRDTFYAGSMVGRKQSSPLPVWLGRLTMIVIGLVFCLQGWKVDVPSLVVEVCLIAGGILLIVQRLVGLVRRTAPVSAFQIFAIVIGILMTLGGLFFRSLGGRS